MMGYSTKSCSPTSILATGMLSGRRVLTIELTLTIPSSFMRAFVKERLRLHLLLRWIQVSQSLDAVALHYNS